jgi:hypothetical protein
MREELAGIKKVYSRQAQRARRIRTLEVESWISIDLRQGCQNR